jgi:hypothetical protein
VAVNTKRVKGRRPLKYTSFEELLADAEKMSSGPVKALGNWSPGQIFRHLAISYNGAIDGLAITFPWHMRLMVKLMKKMLINMDMPAGYQMKEENAVITEPGQTSTEEGLAELRAAVARLKREPSRAKHPLFGNLTNEDWDKVMLAHASMHMSFLVPE